jgi:uncharacterized protein YycO
LKLLDHVIKFTGDVYLSRKPMFLLYKPTLHLVTGDEIRTLLYVVSPGDILLRRWNGYLNTILTGGSYAHAGLYVGNNTVIHATSHGVTEEDILDFCRADSICVLEVKSGNPRNAIDKAKELLGTDYDYDFKSANKRSYCTELTDVCYNGVFAGDYKKVAGNMVLLPDAIRASSVVVCKLEILH